MLYGQIASKAALRDIPETLAPVDADELVRQYGQHQQHLSMLIDEYRRRRSAIDQIVDALL